MQKLASLVLAAVCLGDTATAQSTKGDLAFTYSYPAEVRRIPELKSWFDVAGDRSRSAVLAQARADRVARKDGSFIPYETARTCKTVTETPRFLSLSLEAFDFSGGAHGNNAFNSLLWDKSARQRRTTLSLFVSRQALAAAVRPAFCRQLDAQRREKRHGVVTSDPAMDDFDKCIDPTAQTVILGSTNHQRFDRIGFLIAPYNAGPYSEGAYEVTLPVTPSTIAAVRPEWRPFFAVRR